MADGAQFSLDQVERRGKARRQKVERNPADGSFRRPAVQFRRAAVPISNDVVHVANEDRVLRQVEKSGLLAKARIRRLVLQDEIRSQPDHSGPDRQTHQGLACRPDRRRDEVAQSKEGEAPDSDQRKVPATAKARGHEHDHDVKQREREIGWVEGVNDKGPDGQGGGRNGKEFSDLFP